MPHINTREMTSGATAEAAHEADRALQLERAETHVAVAAPQPAPLMAVAHGALLGAVLSASGEGILYCGWIRGGDGAIEDAQITMANPRASVMLTRPLSELNKGGLRAVLAGKAGDAIWSHCLTAWSAARAERFEVRFDACGTDNVWRCAATPIGDGFLLTLDDVSEERRLAAGLERERVEFRFARDVLEAQASDLAMIATNVELARSALMDEVRRRQELERELHRVAREDSLTLTANRLGFSERARELFEEAKALNAPLSAIVIDADHFKRINDTYGHAAGDRALAHMAGILASKIRGDSDFLGRVGGEEFVVLLPQTPPKLAAILAERLRVALAGHPLRIGACAISITASFGVAGLRDDDDTPDDLIGRADDALYAAKRGGRNRVAIAG